jgi:hypothetical protein
MTTFLKKIMERSKFDWINEDEDTEFQPESDSKRYILFAIDASKQMHGSSSPFKAILEALGGHLSNKIRNSDSDQVAVILFGTVIIISYLKVTTKGVLNYANVYTWMPFQKPNVDQLIEIEKFRSSNICN